MRYIKQIKANAMKEKYSKDDKMNEVLSSGERLLQVVSRFDIPLGVGDKTIEQICNENSIDVKTLLAVVNFTYSAGEIRPMQGEIDLSALCSYLQNTHIYMLNFFLPHIRRHLIDALGASSDNDVTFLIIKFFDEYCEELKAHMETEDKKIFCHIDELKQGKPFKNLSTESSKMHTSSTEAKLSELKNIIIKYYTSSSYNYMYHILQHLFICEYDLYIHNKLESCLVMPEVRRLETLNASKQPLQDEEPLQPQNEEMLTDREKDIVAGVVKGLTNKEIADKLFISVNTVTTHRRNIAKKLNIHSPAGLTIYAIINKLVDIKGIKID